ncbi:MAG: hypothetical protein IJW33_06795 [Lentisphaeria bacterium]|nr:hypothetical protein [Lentisphaeria bacterium]
MKEFIEAKNENRGMPFWAWNGSLDEAILREEIRTMKKMGLGGFFMHARVGLATPYLSEEWFKLIGACVDEAEKQNMSAWIYDEDRWPSGAAGGAVTKDKKYRIRFLSAAEDVPQNGANKSLFHCFFAVKLIEGKMVSYRCCLPDELQSDEKGIYFHEYIAADDPWFNGQAYLDTMNPEAVEKFISVTHEKYKERFAGKFGSSIPGVFTDEPNFDGYPQIGVSFPWTAELPELFFRKFGYQLKDKLPELFYPLKQGNFSKVRLDYRSLTTELFCNAFAAKNGKWCGENNLIFTGHVHCEDTLEMQTFAVGSAMRFYQYMQMPGIDLLTEHWMIFNTVKQCTSVARQFGRQRRLTETYGCTGWDFPLMGHKALGDWQLALGINFRCQHLAWYTMQGQSKRDYPATISGQSPWAGAYLQVEEYFSRMITALDGGQEIRDLLVLHPIESFWGRYTPGSALPENTLMVQLTNELLAQHLDFDFGDEQIMAEYGSCADGTLQINAAVYRAVLIPEIDHLRSTTLDLLEKFADMGGKVFYMGHCPKFLDGEISELPEKVFRKFRNIFLSGLDRNLSPSCRRVSIAENDNEIGAALYLLKEEDDGQKLFICNTSVNFQNDQFDYPMIRERLLEFPEAVVQWNLPENHRYIYQLDPDTGRFHPVEDAEFANGKVRFPLPLPRFGSALFFAAVKPLKSEAVVLPAAAAGKDEYTAVSLAATPVPVTLEEPNTLLLDMPQVKISNGKWLPGKNCLRWDMELRSMMGVPLRGGSMVQPWCRQKEEPDNSQPITLKYRFCCDKLPSDTCKLALEEPQNYTIALNGINLSSAPCGFWCDRSLQTVEIPDGILREGENILLLDTVFPGNGSGLENIFILGDFGVKNECITSPVRQLPFGDWTKNGLPFYTGNLIYELTLPDGVDAVKITDWRGTALAYAVDDSAEYTLLAWPPFVIPVSGGKRLRIKLLNSRRNAFGPFYLKNNWPDWTGPDQFVSFEVAERQLVPCGILQPPELLFCKKNFSAEDDHGKTSL